MRGDRGGAHLIDPLGDILCAGELPGEGIVRGDGGRTAPAGLHSGDPLLDTCEAVFEEADESGHTSGDVVEFGQIDPKRFSHELSPPRSTADPVNWCPRPDRYRAGYAYPQ